MSDHGTTWQDIEPTPQLEKNPTKNALDRFTPVKDVNQKAWHGLGYLDPAQPTIGEVLREYLT